MAGSKEWHSCVRHWEYAIRSNTCAAVPQTLRRGWLDGAWSWRRQWKPDDSMEGEGKRVVKIKCQWEKVERRGSGATREIKRDKLTHRRRVESTKSGIPTTQLFAKPAHCPRRVGKISTLLRWSEGVWVVGIDTWLMAINFQKSMMISSENWSFFCDIGK